ncbi:MAG: GDP-mannose 4,6-dehydratase [Eubacteriaceae bacterium]
MKALITGIEGFVGGYLTEELLENRIEICGTYLNKSLLNDNLIDKAKLYQLDITEQDSVESIVKDIQPDYIFHMAAQSSAALSWNNPNQTMSININGTINLLNSIRNLAKEVKVLLIGSSEEYGVIETDKLPINENQELKPGNPYSISKITQEMIAKLYVNAYDMNIVSTRSFNHIGPKQSSKFVISDWAKQIAEIEVENNDPVIYVGNLDIERDFTDVRDIVRAYVKLIQYGSKGEAYNVGSGKSYILRDILNELIRRSSKPIQVITDRAKHRPIDNPVIRCDNSKLKQCFEWQIQYDIKQSLNDILKYWRTEYRNL